MATTPNYGWTKPTPGGDVGAWGTIANTLFDAADAQVKANFDTAAAASSAASAAAAAADAKAVVARAEILTFPPINVLGNFNAAANTWTPSALGNITMVGVTATNVYVPIAGLATGMRITGFTSYGSASATFSAKQVTLVRISKAAVFSELSAGHTLPVVLAETTTSGLTHDVDPNYSYYFKIAFSGETSGAVLYWFQPVVTRP